MSHEEHTHDEPHVHPLSLYVGVFAALLVLTGLTIGVSFLGLPGGNAIAAAILVAMVKASLVVAFFMHVWGDHHFIKLIIATTVFLLALMVSFVVLDLTGRQDVLDDRGTFEQRTFEQR